MSWNTKNELEFLKKIGTYGVTPKDTRECLLGYLRASEHRHDWGKINKNTVVDFAIAKLDSLGTILCRNCKKLV